MNLLIDVAFACDDDGLTPCSDGNVSSEWTWWIVTGKPGHRIRRPLHVVNGSQSEDSLTLQVNITNAGSRREIPDGEWSIVAFCHGSPVASVTAAKMSPLDLHNASRTFPYNGSRNSYAVTFSAAQDATHSLHMTVANHNTPPSFSSLQGGLVRRLARWAFDRGLVQACFQSAYTAMRLVLPHRGKKRILLAPQLRTDLRDNMLALHRRLVERGLDTEFSVKVFPDVPRTSTIATARHWLTAVKQFAWADFIFLDDWCDLLMYITPSPRTVITQLWHGGFGFKTVGFSQFGLPGGPDLNPPHRKYTYSVVGAEGARDQFAESFGIEREAVLPTGVPRVDDLLDPVRRTEVTERFHDEFPEFTGRRIILFAPTFRGQGSDSAYYPSDLIDWEALHQWCGDDTAVIVAMHPYVTARMVDDQERRVHLVPNNLRDRIREDVTGWPVNDLLLMADTLVTDYSSICYEYTYLQRPIVFYAPDEAEYSATRGFYARLEDVAPGPVVTTFPDLLSALDSNEAANERTLRYRQRFCGPADTHNADRLIDRVLFH